MKKIIFLLTLFSCSIVAFGIEQKDSIRKDEKSKQTTEVIVNFPETVKIKDVSEKHDNYSSYMPWITALIIGILSGLINIWIADRIKKSNEKTIGLQMNNAKNLALSEFKATLGTNNRQGWIDELRHNLSELISESAMIAVEASAEKPDDEKLKFHFKKMNYNKAKISMLINKDKPEQKKVIDCVYELINKSFDTKSDFNPTEFKRVEDELTLASSMLFKIHWKKIKRSFSDTEE